MSDSPSNDLDKKPAEELSDSAQDQDTVIAEDSSTSGEPESKEISTFDLVKDAIKEKSEDEGETEGSSEEDESKDKESDKEEKSKDETESDEPTEEELKAWKPKTRKRFEQLQGKYREATEKLEKLEVIQQNYEKAEVDAGNYRQVTSFLESNNLGQDEANTGLNIMAWMKNDPAKALEALTPYYNQLLEVTGNILPRDLQQEVEQGYITEEKALELSRQRALNNTLRVQQQTMQVRQQDTQQRQQVEQQQQLSNGIKTALANLEDQWKTSDPDYKLKSSRLHDRVKVMWYEASVKKTMPRSVEEAVNMVKKVKDEVDAEVRQFAPRKPVNPIEGNSFNNATPKPNNTVDVIRNALGQ